MQMLLMRILCSPLLLAFRVLGWRPVGRAPDVDKCVVIGAPHTSNWDYVIFLALACYFGIQPKVLVKDTLMRGPLGVFIRFMGGIPVDRTAPHRVVEQVVAMFDQRDRMILLLSPEGTRSKTDCWKRGFYHIAMGAHVPILMAFVDYRNRRAGLGPLFTPSGDIEADMVKIREFYAAHGSGLHPDRVSPVRIRSESRVGYEPHRSPQRTGS